MSDLKPLPPQRLPWVQAGNTTIVPGFGELRSQSVGSTAYTTGLDVYIQREDAGGRLRGCLRFRVTITPDWRLVWTLERPSYPETPYIHKFTEEEIAQATAHVEAHKDKDPVSYFFHVHSAIEMEQHRLQGTQRTLERAVETLSGLLRHKAMPDKWFVPNSEKPYSGGTWRDPTAAEVAERRGAWARNLAHNTRLLRAFHRDNDVRIERLDAGMKAITGWSRAKVQDRHIVKRIEGWLAQNRNICPHHGIDLIEGNCIACYPDPALDRHP